MGALFPPAVGSAVSAFLSVTLTLSSVVLASPISIRRKLGIWVAVVMLALWAVDLADWSKTTQHWELGVFINRDPWSSVLLAAVGVIGIVLVLMPKDGRIAKQRLCGVFFLIAFVALSVATFADWPVWPDAVPGPLLQTAAGDHSGIKTFHTYYLGGFIDRDWLWRIDARPEVLQTVASKLGLSPVQTAPEGFWQMPPYYWPRSLPPGAKVYSTPGFSHGAGVQYCMLVDPNRGTAVVWVKSLFG